MPLYGKLGDLYGRKRILIVAISIFLVASAACGAAQTMDQLLVARFVQGLGGGGLATLAMAAIADIVPARQLGRWLGLPGRDLRDLERRRAGARRPLRRPPELALGVLRQPARRRGRHHDRRHQAAAPVPAHPARPRLARLGHADERAGLPRAGGDARRARAAVAIGAAHRPGRGGHRPLFAVFLWQEQRAPEPVLPLRIIRDPVMRMCVGVNFTSGMLLWCGIFFVPLFVQEVRGVTPTRAGFVLMPLMFSTALGTLVSGRRVERTGRYRVWPLTGFGGDAGRHGPAGHGRDRHVGPRRRRVRPRARHRRRLRDAAVAPRRPEQRRRSATSAPRRRPRCCSARSATPSASRSSAASSTPGWPAGPGTRPPSPTPSRRSSWPPCRSPCCRSSSGSASPSGPSARRAARGRRRRA